MKPMKSSAYVEELLVFPLYGSFKFDGYRSVGVDGGMKSNSLKDIRNMFIQACMRGDEVNGLDGELIVGPPNAPDVYNKSSPVMKFETEPDFKFYVFDDFTRPNDPYEVRLTTLRRRVREFNESRPTEGRAVVVDQVLLNNLEELYAFEQRALIEGYEGVMLRRPDGKYKFGRSTAKEGYLLKVKRFSHGEGVIVGFEERLHNDNEAFIDELGRTARSTAAEGLSGTGMMGALWLNDPKYAEPFKVGCGTMTHDEAKWAWDNRESLSGQVSRYRWFPHGTIDAPRHGMYDGLRDNDDLGDHHPLYRKPKK